MPSQVHNDAVPSSGHDGISPNKRLSASPNAGNVLARAEPLASNKVRVELLKIAVKASDLARGNEGVHLHGAVQAVVEVPLLAGDGWRGNHGARGGDGAGAAEGCEPDHDLVVAGAVAVASGGAGGEDVVGDVSDDARAGVAAFVLESVWSVGGVERALGGLRVIPLRRN